MPLPDRYVGIGGLPQKRTMLPLPNDMTPEDFTLFYPVKPFSVNQPFGVNPALYAKYGLNGHNGLDLLADHGQSVYAAHDGICYPEVDTNGGNGVVLRTLVPFNYQGAPTYFKTIYWHLLKADAVVKHGQKVKAGDLLGYADSTGDSTGDHLHFGLKPQLWNEENWAWYNVEQANGFLGAIDPTPFFTGLYAEDMPRKFVFRSPLKYGDKSMEIVRLQDALRALGFFPATQSSTGYYGEVTARSVLAFQIHFSVAEDAELEHLRGEVVGPATRGALNKLT